MNIKRMIAVADVVENTPHVGYGDDVPPHTGEEKGFNMVVWSCGTSACIGGWTQELYPRVGGGENWSLGNRASTILDLNREEADYLFYMFPTIGFKIDDTYRAFLNDEETWPNITMNAVTPERAALEIRGMVFAYVVGQFALATQGTN